MGLAVRPSLGKKGLVWVTVYKPGPQQELGVLEGVKNGAYELKSCWTFYQLKNVPTTQLTVQMSSGM